MSRPTPEDEDEKLDKKAQQLQSVELKERLVFVEGPKEKSKHYKNVAPEMISDSLLFVNSMT